MTKPHYCILLVDDNLDDRAACRRRLQRDAQSAYQIHDAESGSAGLTACATVQPDCIVLDYRLPDLDGLQFLTHLQEQFGVQAPAVVMMTGTGHEAIVVEAMKRGAQDYLRKGAFTTETLTRAIANAIDKVTLGRRLAAQQHALAESEERYRLVVDALDEGIIVHGADGAITSCNPSAERILGLSAAQLLGRTALDGAWHCVHEDGTPFPGETHPAMVTLRTGAPQSGVIMGVQTPGGDRRWLSVTSRPLVRPGEAQPSAAVVSFADITERKQAEAERERLFTELQRINDELQQFAHIVSHDLNEPLRTMRNFVELLAHDMTGKLDSDTQEYMAFVTDAAQRMQQMLADLLAYTRAGQTPEFQPVDCEAVLAQVLSRLQSQIMECEAIITHDPLPTSLGDTTRLGQVLQNLIGNALKFCEEKPPRIHISAVKEAQHWRFSVRDNGIGIDPQQAGRLFQVFQRLHTRSEYAGSGIGLAICKKIVEQHGGRIWVESRPGEGSSFSFTIDTRRS